MKKEEFKEFVKKNPRLATYVKSNEMTWQKFYEIYDLYGEENDIWKDYIDQKSQENQSEKVSGTNVQTGLTGLNLNQVVNWFKSVDLDSLQEGIGNVQRVLGVVQDFSKKDNIKSTKQTYKPRPLYKHFED